MRHNNWFCLVLLTTTSGWAQKAPELGYVYPPVVRVGQTTKVKLGGYDFTGDMQFFVHHSTIKLETDGKPGPFLVPKPPYWFGEKARGTAFPIPREIDATIKVPSSTNPGLVRWQVANANGASKPAIFYVSNTREIIEQRLRKEPQDVGTLPVAVSGRLQRITEVDRYTFRATKDGIHTAELFAQRLGSNFHAILEARDAQGKVLSSTADTEGIDTALSFKVKKGQQYEIRLHDVDFRGNRSYVYRLALTPSSRILATIPASVQRGKPTDVTFIRAGLKPVTKKVTNPESISISDLTESVEPKLKVPGAVTGTLARSGEEDRYTFHSKAKQLWQIKAHSRILDLELEIQDSTGKTLKTIDDVKSSNVRYSFRAAKEGNYTCVIRDLSGHDGTPASVYRLAIVPEVPGFTLSIASESKILLGGKTQLALKVQRRGGFTGPINLRVTGLPKGVTVGKTVTIPAKKSTFKLPIESAKNAEVKAAMIQIHGESEKLKATCETLLAVTMKPPFSVELIDRNRQRAVHRGTTYAAEFQIKRDEGFTGKIQLQMASRQGRHRQGITGPIITVPPKATKILYPCVMPEWLETDRTTRMVVLGTALVADSSGKLRTITKPANARITMILEGALLKVKHRAFELTVEAGKSFEIPFEIIQSAKLQKPVKIELQTPSAIRGLLSSTPVILSADQRQGKMIVTTKSHSHLQGDWRIKLKATAIMKNGWPAVSLSELTVRFR